MTMSQGFTSGLFTAVASQTRDFSKTLTANMLGLGKASATAAGSATKAASATKAHAAEMKKAEIEARKLEAATARSLKIWQQQESATYALGERLAAVEVESSKVGRSFDLAGARAAAYKDSLAAMEGAFGKFSSQAITVRDEMEKWAAASENGGKVTAQAFGIIDAGIVSLEHAALKTQMLGESFDSISPGLKQAEEDMARLIDLGLKPGNKAFDEAATKLKVYQDAQRQASISGAGLTKTLTELMDVAKTAWGTFNDLLGAVGIELPKGVTAAASAMFQFGGSLLNIVAQLPALISGMTTLTAIIVANPIGAAIAGVALLAAGAIAYFKGVRDEADKTQAEIDAMNAKMSEQELAFASQWDTWSLQVQADVERAKSAFDSISGAAAKAVKDASISFLAGTQDWADNLREQIKSAIFNAVVDSIVSKAMKGKLDDLIGQIVNTFDGGVTAGSETLLKQLQDKLVTVSEGAAQTIQKVVEALGLSGTEVQKLADEAMNAAKKARNDASYGAQQSYHQSLLSSLQRMTNAGDTSSEVYQRTLAAANQAASDLRGMATGGLVTGPIVARMGEGGRNEAVLPLNDSVFAQIGAGIASAQGGSGMQVVINYTGSGKWTREDAQGLGRLLVSELRAMGVRA